MQTIFVRYVGVVVFIHSFIFTQFVRAQGCSDAGFCTIGALGQRPGDMDENRLALFLPAGRGDGGVLVIAPALQYDRGISSFFGLQGKLTFNYANGELASISGPGDLYITGIFSSNRQKLLHIDASVGFKIPLSDGGISTEDGPLPMQYQSSLGTFDILGLATFSYINWRFSVGLQAPLSGENSNGFLKRLWSDPAAINYPNTNLFNRNPDVLLKLNRDFKPSEKINFDLGILWIYHVANDTYIDTMISNAPIEIDGSRGTTLNITTGFHWNTSNKMQIGFIAGMPLIVRNVRPDGLTRSWLFSPEISLRF